MFPIPSSWSRRLIRGHVLFDKLLVAWAIGAPIVLLSGPAYGNSPPAVSEVLAEQRTDESKIVDISYRLSDADGDACTVSVWISDDGGLTWGTRSWTLTGDVGAAITPGVEKRVQWDSSADLPRVAGGQYVVRVCADDGQGSVDGMALIPAGQFDMGDHHDGNTAALPVHTVFVDDVYVDVFEVVNGRYAEALNWAWAQGGLISVQQGVVYDAAGDTPYCDTTTSSSDSRITWDGNSFSVTPGKEDHPVQKMSWFGAAAYANWRSAMEGRVPSYDPSTWACDFEAGGYRLPTEAEWEKGARGGLHDPYRRFPWGDGIDGSQANFTYSGDPYEIGPYPHTTPAGYYNGGQIPPGDDMANGYGLYDVAGNALEWCNDWYKGNYYTSSPYENPRGPSSGQYRVLRGGAWSDIVFLVLNCSLRHYAGPANLYSTVGFRLALDVDQYADSPVFAINNIVIPAVSTWGAVTLSLFLLTAGTIAMRRPRCVHRFAA